MQQLARDWEVEADLNVQFFIAVAVWLNWWAHDLLQSKEKSLQFVKRPSIRALTCHHIWEREATSLIQSLQYVLKTIYKVDSVLPFLQLLLHDWYKESSSMVDLDIPLSDIQYPVAVDDTQQNWLAMNKIPTLPRNPPMPNICPPPLQTGYTAFQQRPQFTTLKYCRPGN